MKLESIRLKNFRGFKGAEMKGVLKFCILVGANGVGKSTVFGVFDSLKDLVSSNVNRTLARIGGSRGIKEIKSRGALGPIKIELKFRENSNSPLATYFLQIDERNGHAYVACNITTSFFRNGTNRSHSFNVLISGVCKLYSAERTISENVLEIAQ